MSQTRNGAESIGVCGRGSVCVTLDCIDEAAIIYMIEHPIIHMKENPVIRI